MQVQEFSMGLGFCPQLSTLFQLQKLADHTTGQPTLALIVLLHCFLFLMLCSLKTSSNSVLSRNVFGLTKCGYSKDSSVILCSLTPKLTSVFVIDMLIKVVCGVSFGIMALCFSVHFQHKIVHMFLWKTF